MNIHQSAIKLWLAIVLIKLLVYLHQYMITSMTCVLYCVIQAAGKRLDTINTTTYSNSMFFSYFSKNLRHK